MNEIRIEKILEIINLNIENADIKTEHIDQDLQELGMDSISFIRIIVSLEEEFELEIPDEFLIITEMNTVNKINNVLMSARRSDD
jgi:acyl carrier protein